MKKTVLKEIVALSIAIENCQKSGNTEWEEKHSESLGKLCRNHLPSGSGIDSGTELVSATPQKVVLSFGYHHMDESGMYDGWTDHKAIVTPSLLSDFDIRITGPNKNDIKSYLYDVFYQELTALVD